MSVETKISRNLGDNYVQVEAVSKKNWTRYFKVPESKADEFCSSYQKHDKKMKKISNMSFLAAPFAGCILAFPFTKNLSAGARMATGVIAGIAAALGSVFASASIMEKAHSKLLKKFDAEEISYDNKKLPI